MNQDLHVESDYGQFYMYDPETQVPVVVSGDDAEDALLLALDEADESRRFLGYRRGLLVFLTRSQYNWQAPMRVEVSDRPPAPDVWPADEAEPLLVKYWEGYELMRP